MTLKSAFLGCGPRARKHAQAYPLVTKGQIAAICDLDEERLHAFGNDFGIERRYTDIHQMLDEIKPDVLHIVTLPTIRVDLLTIANDHGVPVVIVEKPIAIQGEDYRADPGPQPAGHDALCGQHPAPLSPEQPAPQGLCGRGQDRRGALYRRQRALDHARPGRARARAGALVQRLCALYARLWQRLGQRDADQPPARARLCRDGDRL